MGIATVLGSEDHPPTSGRQDEQQMYALISLGVGLPTSRMMRHIEGTWRACTLAMYEDSWVDDKSRIQNHGSDYKVET
jgi:hypothetical protein